MDYHSLTKHIIGYAALGELLWTAFKSVGLEMDRRRYARTFTFLPFPVDILKLKKDKNRASQLEKELEALNLPKEEIKTRMQNFQDDVAFFKYRPFSHYTQNSPQTA